MSLITGNEIVHNYGGNDVLHHVAFSLEEGDRVGLVGPNGEGKTTLLKIIGGLLRPTTGDLSMRRGTRIGYLPQNPPELGGKTLLESTLSVFDDLRQMHGDIDRLAHELSERPGDAALLKRFGTLQHEFEHRGGYTYEMAAQTILTGLKFTEEECHRPAAAFSGGQRTRAMLARLLLEEPDVLLLDEPTNHLDMEAVEWLEHFLAGYHKTLVIVSHDRYFLDRTTDRTWEISFGRLETYRGNYTAYLRQREERFAEQLKTWQRQQDFVKKTEEYIHRVAADKSRARQVRGRATRLERFIKDEAVEKPQLQRHIHIKLWPTIRSGDVVCRAENLVIGFSPDKPILSAEGLTVTRGQRVAVVGGNGTGKTTLVRVLLGEMPPLAGSAQLGANVLAGYLPQMHDNLKDDQTVLQAVQDAGGRDLTNRGARTLLGGFLFTDDEVDKRVGDLSGGQRSRVVLATLAVRGSNLLVLDEPTNHLDIPSQEVLTEVLDQFPGTVIFVSHDRYLIDALATEIWAIDGDELKTIRGNWEAYLAWRSDLKGKGRAEDKRPRAKGAKPPAEAIKPGAQTRKGGGSQKPAHPPKAAASAPADQEKARRNAQRDRDKNAHRQRQQLQRRQQKLEEQIHELEHSLSELTLQISQASVDQQLDQVTTLGQTYQRAEKDLKRLWAEWTDLSERLEG